jgi:hypothetical protein
LVIDGNASAIFTVASTELPSPLDLLRLGTLRHGREQQAAPA